MNFTDYAKQKFLKGAEEHKQRWDKYSINVNEEMRGELADLYNYAELLDDKNLSAQVRIWCQEIFERL